jgi:nitroimidazol reductase NimA-like FMN-containing flavoprotein (pyridoxamine 5'-phosphate oxidase superfamily)
MSETTNPQPNSTPVDTAESEQSTRPAAEMLELDRPECLRLLAATGIGRIAVSATEWDTPVIRPVNYVFDESSQSVLIRSAPGSKLHALLGSAKAAFEIDGIDPAGRVRVERDHPRRKRGDCEPN